MLFTLFFTNSPFGAKLPSMFLLPIDYYEIKKTRNKGCGVFAKRDIEAGTVIGDYVGILITEKEEAEYEKKYGLYGRYLNNNLTIFPKNPKRIGIHKINHSCSPNCEVFTYKNHILYFALRKIFKGEEFTIDYALDKPDKSDFTSYPCHCNSIFCRGTLHASDHLGVRWEKACKKRLKKGLLSVKSAELTPLSGYPQRIPDRKLYDLYPNTVKQPTYIPSENKPDIGKIREAIRTKGTRIRIRQTGLTIYAVVENRIIAQIN